ncbi:hypothetical protein HKK55_00880 [Pseudomonas sp. ADAK18]|uniref:hypothetical protein n=1 Tax=Pseudomonas sp. ADAK18 TaxID=2730848 RepID=UPI001463EFA0|nr:hypothetical protein [Pseudomonas sp. ADAK18]QJI27318.1 hypothetical protein HKK55_00880 [Pseudomonas sp. ADAK18]
MDWQDVAIPAVIITCQAFALWVVYRVWKHVRKARVSATTPYAPGTGLKGANIPVLATFMGIRVLPWVALASNNLNPVLRIDGENLVYRVLRQQQRLLSSVLQVDVRSAYGTFNLIFEFRDSPLTFIANLGSPERGAYVLAMLPVSVALSERARAAKIALPL